jgi:type IV pilus assembly protein PilW
MSRQAFSCTSMNLAYKDKVLLDDAPLWPASIVDGGAKASDTLSIAYMNSLTGAVPAMLLLPMATASATLKISTSPDAAAGKLLLVQNSQPSTPCTLYGISAQTASGFGNDIQHDGGDYNTAKYTNPAAYLENSRASVTNSITWTTFRIKNNTLEEVNNITGNSTAIADGVVALKAQYGITDGSASTSINGWTSATDPYVTPTSTDMLRVRAVRVGLVMQSPEKDSACSGTSSTLALWTDGPTIDISDWPDWKCYRFRTFNMVIPLMNVAMGAR